MFRVGQKVVCVNAAPLIRAGGGLGTLVERAIYTVRWAGTYDDLFMIRVEEIVRPCGDDKEDFDTPYRATRFRPVVEHKTDISIFTAMLTPNQAKEVVR